MKRFSSNLNLRCIVCAASLLVCSGLARAAEVSTNGAGGGVWSEPATWRGNAVPMPDDEVTIRKGDIVTFDRNDDGKVTCAKLFIDPQGGLRFKTEIGKVVFVVKGTVESFGQIKLDGSKTATDLHELHLTGKTPAERLVKFEKSGALIASGKANLTGGKKNVRIVAKSPDPKAADLTGKIDAVAGSALDLQHANLEDLLVVGTEIDNTGSKPNERVNIVGCRFFGKCNLALISCDSPVVLDNLFEYPGPHWNMTPALALSSCPLAEVKNNTILGFFYWGYHLYGATDSVIVNNSSTKAYVAFYCVGTAMFKGNIIREAGSGFTVTSFAGIMEECIFEKCGHGLHLAGGTVQMTNCIYRDGPKDTGRAVEFGSGELTLINCNFGPESIGLPKVLPKAEKPFVTAMNFFVLKINGEVPEEALVDIRTANLATPVAPGTLDLNVRNAPAPLIGNRTPLPQTLSPVILKSWSIDKDGNRIPAPDYTIRIIGPTDGVKERQVFKTLTVKPADNWFRPKPNDPLPTIEVTLK